MKKLLLGGALCAMLSTGAFASPDLTPEKCKKKHDESPVIIASCEAPLDNGLTIKQVTELMKNYTEGFNLSSRCDVEPLSEVEYKQFCEELKNNEGGCQVDDPKLSQAAQVVMVLAISLATPIGDQPKCISQKNINTVKGLSPGLHEALISSTTIYTNIKNPQCKKWVDKVIRESVNEFNKDEFEKFGECDPVK
jgi:hypothetical protein